MSKQSKRLTRRNRTKQKWDREFLGKIIDFENKDEQKLNQKMLKAYKKGYEFFRFGFKEVKDKKGKSIRVPNILEVRYNLIAL